MFKSEFCEVTHLGDLNAVFCQWKKFCKADDYRDPLLYGLRLINENQLGTWITDTSTGFENEEMDTKWLIERLMPELIRSSCKEVIFIIDKDSPLQEEIEGQKEALSLHFKVRLVENLALLKG